MDPNNSVIKRLWWWCFLFFQEKKDLPFHIEEISMPYDLVKMSSDQFISSTDSSVCNQQNKQTDE